MIAGLKEKLIIHRSGQNSFPNKQSSSSIFYTLFHEFIKVSGHAMEFLLTWYFVWYLSLWTLLRYSDMYGYKQFKIMFLKKCLSAKRAIFIRVHLSDSPPAWKKSHFFSSFPLICICSWPFSWSLPPKTFDWWTEDMDAAAEQTNSALLWIKLIAIQGGKYCPLPRWLSD